jgi:hypothetical protein
MAAQLEALSSSIARPARNRAEVLGLKTADIQALSGNGYKSSAAFSEREKAAIAWAVAMTLNTAKSDSVVWQNMRNHFSEAEIFEILLAAAMFNMINRLNDSFWTELESEEYNRRQGNAVKGRSVEQLEDYAVRLGATGQAERARTRSAAAE